MVERELQVIESLPNGRFLLPLCLDASELSLLWWLLIKGERSATSPQYEITDAVWQAMPHAFLVEGCQMDFCEIILSCIQNNEDIQNAIRGSSGGDGGSGGSGGEYGAGSSAQFPEIVSTTNAIQESGCSNDTLFAVARGIVGFTFTAIRDAFEIIEAATNNVELLAELGDNIPVWGQTPYQAALETAAWIQDTAADAFAAWDTIALRDEIACDLFCIMQENCNLTFDDLWNYFKDKTVEVAFDNSLEAMLQQLSGTAANASVGYASCAAFYGTLAIGARFGGFRNVGSVLVRIASFFNDADADWSILCDPCTNNEWSEYFDFAAANSADIEAGRGQWISGLGYRSTIENGQDRIQVHIDLPMPREVTKCEFVFQGQSGANMTNVFDNFLSGVQVDEVVTNDEYTDFAVITIDYPLDANCDQVRYQSVGSNQYNLLSMKIFGTGTNPF